MLAMVLAAVLTFTGATSQAAALAATGSSALRVNVDAPYATVLTSSGIVLLQHFSFGWQALELLHDECDLSSHNLRGSTERMLMRGMPRLAAYRSECLRFVDSGPEAIIDAVRARVGKPFVPSVIVANDWAISRWYTRGSEPHFDVRFYWYHGGGGEYVFHLRRGAWLRVAGGPGAMTAEEIQAAGIPHDTVCAFHFYNMACGFSP